MKIDGEVRKKNTFYSHLFLICYFFRAFFVFLDVGRFEMRIEAFKRAKIRGCKRKREQLYMSNDAVCLPDGEIEHSIE